MIGRHDHVCDVIKWLQDESLVTVTGFHGVGKGTIIKKTAFHLNERQVFEDGIIYISIKEKRQPLQIMLHREIINQLPKETLNQMIQYKIGRKKTE